MRSTRLLSVSCLALIALAGTLALYSPLSRAAESNPDAITSAKLPPAIAQAQKQTHPTQTVEVSIDKSANVTLSAPAASVFIANPDIADVQVVSPTSIMVIGKKAGQTTLLITDNSGRTLAHKTIAVSYNLSDLRDALRTLIPGNTIKVESVPNGIILTGEVTDSATVEDARRLAARYVPKDNGEIINRIRARGNNQIQIRVRFAEVSREVDKRFGINWENAATIGSFTLGLATGPDFFNAATNVITRTTVGDDLNDAFTGSFNNKHFSVNGMIDALAKDGFVTILAEPSLTAMSGETASFLAGGEFPVPVPQALGTVTIEWKKYGVMLAFTPTIIGNNRINLHVRPEVSQLSETGAITIGDVQVPALTTRRAETTIELGSGQSFALAGLLNNQQTQSVSKYPFLGDMPILGSLFRSTRFQNNESELVIIITPYVVKPVNQEDLSYPTDTFRTPTDTDMLLKLRKTSTDPEIRPLSGAPRAVKVEDPRADEAPAIDPAPIAPVTPAKIKGEPPIPALPPEPEPKAEKPLQSLPVSKPVKPLKLDRPAPAGPGGFIME